MPQIFSSCGHSEGAFATGLANARRRALLAFLLLSAVIGTTLALTIPASAQPSRIHQSGKTISSIYLPLALRAGRLDELSPPSTALPSSTPTSTSTPTPTPLPDPFDAVFDPDRVLDIEITMAPDDWAILRVQARTLHQILGGTECRSEPPVRPYEWFPGDVVIDGTPVANVAVRKKGLLGSVEYERPSLKIKFDEYEPDQRFSGLRRMTLNNNRQDESLIRQCLSYSLLEAAGVPAARCNFARMTVNGEDLGIYTHIESIKKPFLARRFDDDGGNLYEGVLADFRTGWVDAFELKTNTSDPDRSDLDRLAAALESDDDSLIESLRTIVDLDQFMRFWAMETLLSHWDGYSYNQNNVYLYLDPSSDRFHFIPWGTDGVMIVNSFPLPGGRRTPTSVLAKAQLPHRLFEHSDGRKLYYRQLDDLLEFVWDEEAIQAEIDRMRALLLSSVPEGRRTVFSDQIRGVERFVRERRSAIRAERTRGLAGLDPARGQLCRRVVGHVSVRFSAPWASRASADATVDLKLGSVEQTLLEPRVRANYGRTSSLEGWETWPEHPSIEVSGRIVRRTSGFNVGDRFTAIVFVDPQRYREGGPVAVNGHDAFGRTFRQVVGSSGGVVNQQAGFVWGGDMAFETVGTDPGDIVAGTIEGDVIVLSDGAPPGGGGPGAAFGAVNDLGPWMVSNPFSVVMSSQVGGRAPLRPTSFLER